MPNFQIVSDFKMTGDQPQAVERLVAGLNRGFKHQTLLGVTGSGKTFTMANVTLTMVNVLPLPVTPSSVWCLKPLFNPATNPSTAWGWSPVILKSETISN